MIKKTINKKLKQFPIISICREDLESEGFDASMVKDDTMKQIASKMADAYLNSGFWIDVVIIAEHYNVPRKISKK